jgi:hypothetical protein
MVMMMRPPQFHEERKTTRFAITFGTLRDQFSAASVDTGTVASLMKDSPESRGHKMSGACYVASAFKKTRAVKTI